MTLQLPQEKSALHGDIPQCNREYIFKDFKQGVIKCLIATNVAARGLDISSVDLIIQM
jgi:ATP-dependent RNA helicase DDX21